MKAVPVQFSPPALPGGFSVTSTGFGTCKGGLVVGTRGATNDTITAEASMGIGAHDGTTHRCVTAQSRDAVATTVAKAWPANTMAYRLLGAAGGVDGEMEANGFVADGIQFDIIDTFAGLYQTTVMMLGDDDCQVKVASTSSFPGIDGTLNATVGFEPKVVFTFSNFLAFGSAAAGADASISMGVAWNNNGTWENYCISKWDDDAVATTASAACTYGSHALVNIAGGALVSSVDVTASSSTGFTLTTRVTAVAVQTGWMAVTWSSDQKFWAGSVNSITATGVKSYTSPGFPLSFAGLLMTRCTALGTIKTDADGGIFAVGLCGGTGKESGYCISTRDAVALGTTTCKNDPSNDTIRLLDHTGALTTVANFSAWNALGVDFDAPTTATDGTTRKWILFGWGNPRLTTTTGQATASGGVAMRQALVVSGQAAVTSTLTLKAAGFAVSGQATTTSTLTMKAHAFAVGGQALADGGVTMRATGLTFDGQATASGDVGMTGTSNGVASGQATVTGGVSFVAEFQVAGQATASGGVTMASQMRVTGQAAASGSVNMQGTLLFTVEGQAFAFGGVKLRDQLVILPGVGSAFVWARPPSAETVAESPRIVSQAKGPSLEVFAS